MHLLTLAEFHWSAMNLAAVLGIGLVAGVLGGLLGVGGSIIMIPGLVFLFGQNRTEGMNQHVYQAAAMLANVAVAVPATLRHRRAGALRPAALKIMVPVAVVFVLIGVAISNLPLFRGAERGIWLGRLLAFFLVYEVYYNIKKLRHGESKVNGQELEPTITPGRSAAVGTGMGLVGGLLGVGGGVIAVPLQQLLLHMPLRIAIANSAATMCVSALLGAIMKNSTLAQHGVAWYAGLVVAAGLIPTCMAGGYLGAHLSHRLPLRQVRMAFVVLLAVFAWKLAALPWP